MIQNGPFGRDETNLIECDGSTAIGIEYRHQELASVKIKGYTEHESGFYSGPY